MKRNAREKRRLGGYTMAEVLIVVALIGILAGLTIPAVIAYRRDLKLTELDDNARTIYLAAQNNLTAIRTATEIDPDAGREANVPDVPGLRYVSTDVPGAEPGWMVLPGSVDLALMEEGSCYLVEFDPASGVVYGAFYTEIPDGKPLNESAYDRIRAFAQSGGCRVRAGRNAFATASDGFLLGYYGADGAMDFSRPDAKQLPKPKLKLVNAEELVLEMKAEAGVGMDLSRVFYTVSLTDGAHTKTIVEKGNCNDGGTNTVVLDTLQDTYAKVPENTPYGGWSVGNTFSGWVQGSGIVPGVDVDVTVTIWYEPKASEGLAALPQSASVSTNSLFAQRNEDTVQVSYGRHLQNLGRTDLDPAVTAAVQIREIDFAKTGTGIYSWADTYGERKLSSINNINLDRYDGRGLAIRNMNASGMPYGGLFGTFRGSTLENILLVDAKVYGPLSAGSLAGTVWDSAGSGVRHVVRNCKSYLSRPSTEVRIQGSWAGGLIGNATNTRLEEGSFAATVVSGSTDAGGLVGMAGNVSIANCYAACHLSGGNVGGLVGMQEAYSSPITVTNSYAAGTIAEASTAAGGLVAAYAVDTDRPSYPVTVAHSYAAVDYGDLSAFGGKVYGLIPPRGACESTAYYLVDRGLNDQDPAAPGVPMVSTEAMQTLAGLTDTSAFAAGGNAGVRAWPYNLPSGADPRDPALSAPYPYPTLVVGTGEARRDLPHYGDWLEAVAPPAPQSLLAYYEQYPSGEGYATEYHAYVNGGEKSSLTDRTGAIEADGYAFLSAERLQNDWENETGLTVRAEGVETRETTVEKAVYLGALDEELQPTEAEPAAYYAYAIPTAAIDVVPNGGYAAQVTVKGTRNVIGMEPLEVEATGWVNPLFACSAYNGTAPSNIPGVIHVRSVRQLGNVGRFYGAPDYVQDLDIDASRYKGDLAADRLGNPVQWLDNSGEHTKVAGFELWGRRGTAWGYESGLNSWNMPEEYRLIFAPIGSHGNPSEGDYGTLTSFNGTYDGNGRLIRGLSIRPYYYKDDGVYYSGVFYRVISGTLKNITLEDCDIQGTADYSNSSTGALLGRLSSAGRLENCVVRNCDVAVAGTKAGGYAGGLVGYADNGEFAIAGCAVENTRVDGGGYTYDAGGLVGCIYKQGDTSAVRDCTARDVQVSNGFSKESASSVEKRGSMGGFVGCMRDGQGTVTDCYVIGTGKLGVSGASPYSGGFVGLLSDKDSGAVQNSGVRLEGQVKTGYDAQIISGGKYVGGFAGLMAGGEVSASYAAVRVSGVAAGGFAGSVSGGRVTSSYAGGHTKSGKFAAGTPNVTGTDTAGGLVGLWSGGELEGCYTTCAVSGTYDGKTDVFANTSNATVSAKIPGCYALGEAFVGGAKYGKFTKTSAATTVPELPQDQRTESHPYDTLKNGYPYAPAKYATGAAIPHYGDWPSAGGGRTGFEWEPIPEEFVPSDLQFLRSAQATWTEEGLSITIETEGSGTTLANLFALSGGCFRVSSDMGEVLTFQVENTGGAGAVRITDPHGHVWEITPSVVANTADGQPVRAYQFKVPADCLPEYLKTLQLGGFKQGDMIDEIKYEGAAEGFHPVEEFMPGDSVAIDGNFDDWTGYRGHQILAYTPGNGNINGTAIGAAFGDGNDIYLHIRNEYPSNLVPADQLPYTGSLSGLIVLNLPMTAQGGDRNWGDTLSGMWWKFTNQTYTGPGIYKLIDQKWGALPDGSWGLVSEDCVVECYLEVRDDGSQEMEMLLHLEALTGSPEEANKILTVTVRPALGGSLTIQREPPEE